MLGEGSGEAPQPAENRSSAPQPATFPTPLFRGESAALEAPRAEVLRYLGYRGQAPDQDTGHVLDSVAAEASRLARPRWCWRAFAVDHAPEGLLCRGSTLVLPGRSMAVHNKGALAVAVLCVTAGPAIDREVLRAKRRDAVRALAWDATGTALVEEAADACNAQIEHWARAAGMRTNSRYSPGYGDLPLSVQPALLRSLDAQPALGVSLTPQLLMVPQKTVTAVIGLFAQEGADEGPAAVPGVAASAFGPAAPS